MSGGGFEWDPAKATVNRRKHGIPFEDAATVFADPCARHGLDETRGTGEQRWTVVGWSASRRILCVVFTCRGENVRIISARRATGAERRSYEEAED